MRSEVSRLLRRGALPGALVFAGLFVLDLACNSSLSVFGQESSSITDKALGEYLGTTLTAQAAILVAFLVVGALLGVAALWTVTGLLGRPPGRPGLASAGMAFAVHALVVASHVQKHPQLYADQLCARGEVPAAIQKAITHHTPRFVFHAALAVCALLFAIATFRALRGRARAVASRIRSAPRAALVAFSAAAVVSVPLALALASGENGGTPGRPNILILANDSMRPDHLGFNGHPRPTSPAMDEFAQRSVVFEQAYVSLARTFPSWATILTGRLPHEHGIRHMFPRPENRLAGIETLPRFLARHGYRTAVIADYAGDVFPRMEAGFETVVAPDFDFESLIRERSLKMHAQILPYLAHEAGRRLFPDQMEIAEYAQASVTTDRLIRAIDDGDGRPFFVVAFYSSSHFPYAAPYPFYLSFSDPGVTGPGLYMRFRRLSESAEGLAAEADRIANLYDGTIRAFDAEFGRVLDHLRERDLERNTIVVLLSDHGESLSENGTNGHGDHLRGRESNRIPLVVRAPGLGPRRVKALVRSQDLARTLVALAGMRPPEAFGGEDLGPLLRGERESLGLVAVGETGLWFTEDADEFYQRERLSYPDLTRIAETLPDRHGEICIRPEWEDLVTVAKHRAAWSETRKVVYVPTPSSVALQAFRVEGEREVPDTAPDPSLVAALRSFLSADAEIVGGYALPRRPVAEP